MNNRKIPPFIATLLFALCLLSFQAQDIPVTDLPPDVKAVLDQYIAILNSPTLDDCAKAFIAIAGGGLINQSGTALAMDIKEYSLKKDFNDVKYYKQPVLITRVNKRLNQTEGYGATQITGTVYKIWIDKKDPSLGMPAPISIMMPIGHPTITTPKVIGIGSL